MKIKSDFVTNSSSTCYIVLIPNNFIVSDEVLNTHIEKLKYEDPDDFPPYTEIKDTLNQIIEKLKNGGEIWAEETDYIVYQIIQNILNETPFIVKTIDSGPDENRIAGLLLEKVRELIDG